MTAPAGRTRQLIATKLVTLVVLGLALPAGASFQGHAEFGEGFTIPVAWGDFDNDGDLDLAVGNYNGGNYLFVNNGDGSFTQESQFGVGPCFAVAWGDYDNDGDPDLAVGFGVAQLNKLYVNNGDGTFTVENQFGANRTTAMAWADYDLDGDLDMAVGNGILNFAGQNYLYINNGDGTFSEEAQFGAEKTGSLIWGDFDNDGDPDLAVGNGGFGYVAQNYLYINNGDGSFTQTDQFGLRDTACLQRADFDTDGDLDVAVGNWGTDAQSFLYINNGDGSFTADPQFGALDTNTLTWGDADNDGDLDMAVGNGDFNFADQNHLYDNNNDGTFTELPDFGEGSTDGVAWGDLDNDGDLDLAVGNEHSPTTNYVYVNQTDSADYLLVLPVGRHHEQGAGYSNRDGIGARIEVYTGGHLGDPTYYLGNREILAHGGFASQNARAAHFGLPGVATADLRITWPGSAGAHIVQEIEAVALGQQITVIETGTPAGIADDQAAAPRLAFRVAPHPMVNNTKIDFWVAPGESAQLEVCNVCGQIIRTLAAEGSSTTGRFRTAWDGRMDNGSPAPAGLYLVRSQAARAGSFGRILLVR